MLQEIDCSIKRHRLKVTVDGPSNLQQGSAISLKPSLMSYCHKPCASHSVLSAVQSVFLFFYLKMFCIFFTFDENVQKSRLCGVHSTQKYWNIGNVNKTKLANFEGNKSRVLKQAYSPFIGYPRNIFATPSCSQRVRLNLNIFFQAKVYSKLAGCHEKYSKFPILCWLINQKLFL